MIPPTAITSMYLERSFGVVVALVLTGCAAETKYTVPAATLKRIDQPGFESFFLAPEKDVIEPVPFGGWFVSSQFILRLADLYEKVGALGLLAPEYCSLIWVDAAAPRLVHASKLVQHDVRTGDQYLTCPALGGRDLTVGQSHSHQVAGGLSRDDTFLANVFRKNGKYGHVQFVVLFSDGDQLLAGHNPETGQRESVPQQNFLFTKVREKVRVYMWVPLEPTPGLRSLVQVYVPDSGDGWRKATRCWVSERPSHPQQRRKAAQSVPEAECDDETIWQQ